MCKKLIIIFLILNLDGLGAFGIIRPKEPVTKGDDIELVCAASIYNYTNELTWSILSLEHIVNQTEEPLVETGIYFKRKIKLKKNYF